MTKKAKTSRKRSSQTDEPTPQDATSAPPSDGAPEAPASARSSRQPSPSRRARRAKIAPVGEADTNPRPRAATRRRATLTASTGENTGATSLATLPDPGQLAAAAERVKKVMTQAAPPASTAPSVPAPRPGEEGAARGVLSVLFVASEALPFVKSGGLADVAAALPEALARRGHRVTLVTPRYRAGAAGGERLSNFDVPLGDDRLEVACYDGSSGAARVVLVDAPALFDREGLYGVGNADYEDNPRRFATLSRAALELASREGRPIDIVHAHDWQTGLVPVYRRTAYYDDPVFASSASVFTIHNVAYQGLCAAGWLPALGLGWDLFSVNALEYWGQVSLLKGGITFSDAITTVSPRYATEILTSELGFGFGGILATRQADFTGVLNGIDGDVWNPSTDRHLPQPYDATDMTGKLAAKRALLEAFGFAADETAMARPLVAIMNRMVHQKGLDLIDAVADRLPSLGATFIVMGEGDPRYEGLWRDMARSHPDAIGVRVGFEDALSHLMVGGADLFLMPSRFEPCGLTQMYSLRYGTVPVVHRTGGLADTVLPYDAITGQGTGFAFSKYTPEALLGTLEEALTLFRDRERWHRLRVAGMRDLRTWDDVARDYEAIYARAQARASALRQPTLAAV